MTKQQIVDEFHKLAYSAAWEEQISWQRTQWMGFPLLKMPGDLLNLSDLIWNIKPHLIVETGTAAGGSALFMATLLDGMGTGKIVTIDVKQVDRAYPAHPRIAYLGGRSSTEAGILNEVGRMAEFYGGPVMVILDSDHSQEHVTNELTGYSGFVSPGSYLIVEDTNVNGHPVLPEFGPGPYEALQEWLPKHPEFREDTRIPSYHLFSTQTWLRKSRV
jgi:cephalosporin hydroxylase